MASARAERSKRRNLRDQQETQQKKQHLFSSHTILHAVRVETFCVLSVSCQVHKLNISTTLSLAVCKPTALVLRHEPIKSTTIFARLFTRHLDDMGNRALYRFISPVSVNCNFWLLYLPCLQLDNKSNTWAIFAHGYTIGIKMF